MRIQSLEYKSKSAGELTAPCGSPSFKHLHFPLSAPIHTQAFLSSKKLFIHLTIGLGTPSSIILSVSLTLQTLS